MAKRRKAYNPTGVCISPSKFYRDKLSEEEHLCIVLYLLLNFNMAQSYRLAFNFKGKAISLYPIASKFFGDPRIKEACEEFGRYYSSREYDIPIGFCYYNHNAVSNKTQY